MSRLAIITARGGSKRIPKKNIREFCGKPILAYSIEAALSSGLFDHVMVSTDDEEIAQIAEKYGAEVPFFRSEATSGDFATTNDVLAEVLAEYEKRGDLIVPNSAIREDSNGKFILIVESKSSPLGNRYVATRVDVEVLASDDTQSAVSGALYGYEFVITTSTQPVEAGKLVRLANNS